MRLATERQWVRLGHWVLAPSGDWRGQPDGPTFYLAPDGKTNPQAELDATLRAIWAPDPTDPMIEPPMCRFPARLAWLDEIMGFDWNRMPHRRCAKFEHFAARMRAESVALVFSSYYLSSPASAFGHTFLRIHKAGNKRENALLDEGIDYSATVDTNNALLYAFKGIVGLFPGIFRALPYYYKVREYNDFESRDLWEYELNLTDRQVAMLVAHLWELGSTYFDYYYLSENCSYHSLAVVGVANPALHLMEHVKYPTVPIDTVRALFKNPGLVREIRYRPSLRTTVKRELQVLSAAQRDAIAQLIGNADASLPAGFTDLERAQVLDAASDLIDFREAGDVLADKNPKIAALKQRLLERRAAITISTDPPPVPIPEEKIPHMGHATQRVSLGTGYSPDIDGGGGFYELGARLALHDLADPSDGYPETSGIEFLPTRVRFYPKPRAFELEDTYLARVTSLVPWERFSRPLSFEAKAGVTRLRDAGCFDCAVGDFDVAGGLTLGLGQDDHFAFYAMGNVALDAAAGLQGLGGSVFRPGVGPLAGFRWRLARTLVWTADGRALYLPDASPNTTWLAETTVRWEIAPNGAFGFDLRRWPLATEGAFAGYLYY